MIGPGTFDFSSPDTPDDESGGEFGAFDFSSPEVDEPKQQEANVFSFDTLLGHLKPITDKPADSFNWFMGSAAKVGQSAGWLMSTGAEMAGESAKNLLPGDFGDEFVDNTFGAQAALADRVQSRSKESADYWLDKVSAEFKAQASAGLDSPEFGLTTLYAAALGSLPEMMLTMGSGAVAGKLTQMAGTVGFARIAAAAEAGSPLASKMLAYAKYAPAIAGAAAGGMAEGSLAAGATGVAMEERVNAMTHEELIESSDRYRDIYDSAIGESEDARRAYAKKTVAEELGRTTASWVGLSTAALGAPTGAAMGYLGGRAAGAAGVGGAVKKLEGSVAGQAAVGAVGEGAQEFLQEGSQQFLTNLGLREYVNPKQALSEGVMDNAVIGGLVGGLMGGTLAPLAGGGARAQAKKEGEVEATPEPGAEIKYSRNPLLEAKIIEQVNQLQGAATPAGEFQKVARWAEGRSALEFSKALEQLIETGVAPDNVTAMTGDDFDADGMLTEQAYTKDAARLDFAVEMRVNPVDDTQRADVLEALAADGANPYVMGDGTLVVPQSEPGRAGLQAVADSIQRRTGAKVEIVNREDHQGAEAAVTAEDADAEPEVPAVTAAPEELLTAPAATIPDDIDDTITGLRGQYALASEVKPVFDAVLADAARAAGGVARIPAELKGGTRASEKVRVDYGGDASRIKDIVRGTIDVESLDDVEAAVAAIEERFDVLPTRKNTLDPSVPTGDDGYRDIKLNVDLGNGLIGEVQINLHAMLEAKHKMHPLYKQAETIRRKSAAENRSLTAEEAAEITRLDQEQAALYSSTFESSSKAPGKRLANSASSTMEPLRFMESMGKRRGLSPSSAQEPSPPASGTTSATGTPSTSQSRLSFTEAPPSDTASVTTVDAPRKHVTVKDAGGIEEMGRRAATHPDNEGEPSERQLAAGNYTKGKGTLKGAEAREDVKVSIENVPGSIRRAIGGGWSRKMKHWYGYVRGTKEVGDGKLDVYIARNAYDNSLPVFVVHQNNTDGTFDEPKVMMGYASEGTAKAGYLSEYPAHLGPKLFGGITRLSRKQFADWIESGDTDVPPNPMTKAAMVEKRKTEPKKDYRISPYRYAKDSVVMQSVNDGSGWKNRADRLADAMKARWAHRAGGYVMSAKKAAKFEELYAAGWDGNSFTGELNAPTEAPAEVPVTRKGKVQAGTAEATEEMWKPASGHRGGWRVVRGDGMDMVEADGPTGKLRLFKTMQSAQKAADALNAETAPRKPGLLSLGGFKTGKKVTFRYLRNTEGVRKFGAEESWGRDLEPFGTYVLQHDTKGVPDGRWQTGSATMNSPLVMPWEGWKKALSEMYGGKTGKELTEAVIEDGFDGIVTMDTIRGSEMPSEIVVFDDNAVRPDGALASVSPNATKHTGTHAEAEAIVTEVLGKLKGAPSVTTHRSEATLPSHLKMQIDDHGAHGLIEGIFDPNYQDVHIITGNVKLRAGETFRDAVERVVAEETLGHYGLHAVFREGEMNRLMDAVWDDAQNTPRMKNIVKEYSSVYGDIADRHVQRYMANEFLAKLGEEERPTLWNKITAWLREALRKQGFVKHWTDNDLKVLMARVFNAVKTGQVPTSIVKLRKAVLSVDADVTSVTVRDGKGQRTTEHNGPVRRVNAESYRATMQDGMERGLPALDVSSFSGDLRKLAEFAGEEGKHLIVAPESVITAAMVEKAGFSSRVDEGARIIQIPGELVNVASKDTAAMFSLRNRATGDAEIEAILAKTVQPHTGEMTWGQRIQQWAREATGILGEADTYLELKTGWIDSAAAIEKLERGQFDGKLLDASESAYKMVSLTKNLPQVAAAWFKAGVPAFKDGSFVRVPGRKGPMEIFAPLFKTADGKNLLHLWEGYAVARRSSQLINQTNPDGTSKEKLLTHQEIEKLLSLEREYPVFRKVFDEWQVFNHQALDLAVERGAMDKETAELWKKNDYVPFYRVDDSGEEVAAGITRKRGLSGQRVTSKRLTGSDKRIQPVLENIMLNSISIIDKIYTNEAMNRVVALADGSAMTQEPMRAEAIKMTNEDLARALHKAGLFVGDDSNSTPRQRQAGKLLRDNDIDYAVRAVENMTPEQRESWTTLFRRVRPDGPDVVSVMVAGKPVYYRVHDPLLLRAIMDMTPTNFGALVNVMGGAKRLLTSMVTLDPGFMVANYLRDTLSSWVVVDEKMKPFQDAASSVADIWTESGLSTDLALAGGMTGGFFDPTQDFADVLHEVTDPGVTVLNSPKKLLDTYRKIGMVSEQVNRMAIAKAVLRRGGSMAEAAYQAQDVLNFSQSGDAVACQLLIRTVPFLNARIQGLYRLWKGANGLDGRDPLKARMAFFLKGLFLAGISMLLSLKNRGDERYEKLPEFQKDVYWHFFVGDNHYAIPKPFEVGVLFSTLPERAMRLATGDDNGRETGNAIARALGDTFAFNPVPQLFKPVVEQWANRSFFTDRPIVGLELMNLEPQAQYNPWTSETARTMANIVDQVVPDSMNRMVPETLQSPTRLESAMRAYLGTVGAYILQLSDAALRGTGFFPAAPAMDSVRDVPVLGSAAGRFVRGDPALQTSTKYADDLYDALKKADAAYATMNAYITRGNMEAASEIADRRINELTVRPVLHDFKEAAAELNTQQRLIMQSDLSPEEKRDALNEITRTKNEIMKEAIPYLALMGY